MEDTVIFYGTLPIDEISEAMANSDLGIVPKRKDSFGNEAFSTKIFEFMSVGVPVLVSDTKIDKFYFNDDIVQFFTSGDEHDLADKLLKLIKDEDFRVRKAAISALHIDQIIQPRILDSLFDILINDETEVAKAAASNLARAKTLKNCPEIIKRTALLLSKHPDNTIIYELLWNLVVQDDIPF